MELFELKTASGLSIGNKVPPVKFRDVMPEGASEQDLENLIVRHPSLLNWSDVVSFESAADLIIISRQAVLRPASGPICLLCRRTESWWSSR